MIKKSLLSNFFNFILDIILPQTCIGCGYFCTLLCDNCHNQIDYFGHHNWLKNKNAEPNSEYNLAYLDDVKIATHFVGISKKIVHKFKYESIIGYAEIIAYLIYNSLSINNNDYITFVPLTEYKKNQRGFNQTEEICKCLSKITNIPMLNILQKIKSTQTQMSIKDKKLRSRNQDNVFAIRKFKDQKNLDTVKKLLESKKIIIIDDVITTGSTLNQCAKVLKDFGVGEITGVAFASGA